MDQARGAVGVGNYEVDVAGTCADIEGDNLPMFQQSTSDFRVLFFDPGNRIFFGICQYDADLLFAGEVEPGDQFNSEWLRGCGQKFQVLTIE